MGQTWVDWLFMIGLAGIGAALVPGIGMRIAATTGGLLLLMMWAAELPLTTNPFIDEHIVYAIVLAGLALAGAGTPFGLGKWWAATPWSAASRSSSRPTAHRLQRPPPAPWGWALACIGCKTLHHDGQGARFADSQHAVG
ncbi:hypothetical protein [Microbispora maris]|uniref:hypothetical protein n=1 Tax=Microbispora maris TaxID=3144104 RepID=UPI003D154CC5